MTSSALLLVPLFLSIASGAQTSKSFTDSPTRAPQPPVELAHDVHVRQLLANSQVRVFRVELAANEETALDRHDHDFLIISLGNNDFEIAGPGNAYPMTMGDSEVQVLKGHWPHRLVNESKNPLRLIEVETIRDILPEQAVCGLVAQSCTGAKFAKDDNTNYVESTLFITPSMRLAKVQIEPMAGMPEHAHTSAHLMIALNDQQMTNAIVAGATTKLDVRAGNPTWLTSDIVHRLINTGSQPARFLTIEWK
jgi:mannose-6-phosphate isomerase-like protein (cupin superfamily)